jgi:DNA-directed RNA polymerase specialized sigma24 family protein
MGFFHPRCADSRIPRERVELPCWVVRLPVDVARFGREHSCNVGAAFASQSGEGAMPAEQKLQCGQQRRFETTRWSLVLRAAGEDGRKAASQLCDAYWWPVYAFFRSKGARKAEAADITQEFFGALHRRRDLSKVDPERGSFRSWLCVCAERHLYGVRKYERAAKRNPGRVPLSLDGTPVAERPVVEPKDLLTPEHEFNRSWALALHARVMDRLRAYYAARGKLEVFQSLEAVLSGAGSKQSDSEGALRVARSRVNKEVAGQYRRYLRAEIGETVSGPEEIDDEIRELLAALSQPLGILDRGGARDVRASPFAVRRAG